VVFLLDKHARHRILFLLERMMMMMMKGCTAFAVAGSWSLRLVQNLEFAYISLVGDTRLSLNIRNGVISFLNIIFIIIKQWNVQNNRQPSDHNIGVILPVSASICRMDMP
jgi:hypothetical protein